MGVRRARVARHGPRDPEGLRRAARAAVRLAPPRTEPRGAPRRRRRAPQPARAEHRRGLALRRPLRRAEDRPGPRRARGEPPLHRRGRRDLQLRVVAGAEARAVVGRVRQGVGPRPRPREEARAAGARDALQHERRLQPGGDPEPARPALHLVHPRREGRPSRRRRGRREGVARRPRRRDPGRDLEPHHPLDDARLPAGGDREDRPVPPRGGRRPHLGQAEPDAPRARATPRAPEQHVRLRHRGPGCRVRARPEVRGRAPDGEAPRRVRPRRRPRVRREALEHPRGRRTTAPSSRPTRR